MNNENTINLVKSITELTQQNTNLYTILVDIMKELSVIYPTHEIETLPAKVKEVVQRLTEAENELHLFKTSSKKEAVEFLNNILYPFDSEQKNRNLFSELREGIDDLAERKDLEEWAFYESGLVAHGYGVPPAPLQAY